MASSAQAVRRALRGLDDGLAVFTTQLATEAAELRRNVEQRPCTGATFYRNCLHDLAERLEAVGEELTALEAVSTEAVSLEVRRVPGVAPACLSPAVAACWRTQPLLGSPSLPSTLHSP